MLRYQDLSFQLLCSNNHPLHTANLNAGEIGSSVTVSRCKSCCIRPRIKLKVAFDTRNVFLNLWSVSVFHTSSNHPLLRGSRRHDRSAVVFSEEIRRAERKKLLIITFAWRSKGKGFSAAFLFFSSSSFVRVLPVAIYAGGYGAAPFSSPITAVPADYCTNTELSSTLARRLNWSRACAVLLSNPILIRFGTAEARRLNWA